MSNVIKVTTENPDEVLNAGAYGVGALIRIQSSATQAGTFANLSGTGSTPTVTVVGTTRLYTAYDPNGAVSTWYRTRYESSDAGRLSTWSTAFQVGDETAGLLCSIYDARQRIGGAVGADPNDDEVLLDIIREVSDDIEDYVGAWLAPRPADPASTMTMIFDVESDGRTLILKSGQRQVGIRNLTALDIASVSQPESGGTYISATIADVLMRPRPSADGPASRLVISDQPTGAVSQFYGGYNAARATGSFGPASVAPRFQGVAIAAVTRRWLGKDTASPAIALGPDGGVRLLADISPGMKATLDRARGGKVG